MEYLTRGMRQRQQEQTQDPLNNPIEQPKCGTMNKMLSNAYLGLKAAVVVAGLAYGVGVVKNTQKLSEELQPLRTQFVNIIQDRNDELANINSKDARDFTFNYQGKLEEIANVKNQFAEDNGALKMSWKAYSTSVDTENQAKTCAPWALNPLKWGKELNTRAIDAYLKK